MPISPIPELVAELAAGRMVILVDEEDRENEGDLIIAADHVTPAAINFMARLGRGLICLTLTRERCERLQLPPMTTRNGTRHATAFTVSIKAATGVTTGISAADRARTVQAAVAPGARAGDLVQPGHIFPLQAQDGGVLMRAGHTEAGCDLARMAGLTPAAVICEIMNDDGTMARLPDLEVFAHEHGLKIGTIAALIEHRSRHESLIKRVGQRPLKTPQGDFDCHTFRDRTGGLHLALTHGRWQPADVMMRLDDVRLTGFSARRFNNIRIDGALCQPFDITEFGGFLFENLHKQRADDFALLFRIGDAAQGGKKAMFGIDPDHPHPKMLTEGAHDLIAFIKTQQAGINEYAR